MRAASESAPPSHADTCPAPHLAKALELFLGLIIDEASKVTKERGSKKVEAYHLCVCARVLCLCACPLLNVVARRKHAVETTETLDFLKELVQAIPDPSAGGTIDFEAENAEKKKRGKARRAPADPNAPKRRRKKKGEEEAGDDVPMPGTGTKKEEPDEDVEMQDDQDEYDDDDDARPAARGPSSSYRPTKS